MGELIDLNGPKVLSDGDIPALITRDTEFAAALAAALAKTLTLFPRSSGQSIDANNSPISGSSGWMWLDGDTGHSNVPAGTGTLIEINALSNTTSATNFRIQIMIPRGTSPSNTSLAFIRHQNNGTWTLWRSF
jgi:hypothetical protein